MKTSLIIIENAPDGLKHSIIDFFNENRIDFAFESINQSYEEKMMIHNDKRKP